MKPHPGLCAVVGGIAVQFLYMETAGETQWWKARKIFVKAEDILVQVHCDETFRPIHG